MDETIWGSQKPPVNDRYMLEEEPITACPDWRNQSALTLKEACKRAGGMKRPTEITGIRLAIDKTMTRRAVDTLVEYGHVPTNFVNPYGSWAIGISTLLVKMQFPLRRLRP